MGLVKNITHDTFPKQGDWVGKRVRVCFHYDLDHVIKGTIIRDDKEEPGITLIQLDNGRTVLSTECQFSFEV